MERDLNFAVVTRQRRDRRPPNFGSAIKLLRTIRGTSQLGLAKAMGLKQGNIVSHHEAGRMVPSLGRVAQYAMALDVSVLLVVLLAQTDTWHDEDGTVPQADYVGRQLLGMLRGEI